MFLGVQEFSPALNKGGNFHVNSSVITVVANAFLFQHCHSGKQSPAIFQNVSQIWILRICQEMLLGEK